MRRALAVGMLAIPAAFLLGGQKGGVATVTVQPDTMALQTGEIGRASCTPRNKFGTVLTNGCTWTSRDTAVVKSSTGGQSSSLMARKVGAVVVLAAAGAGRDSLRVTVLDTVAPIPLPPAPRCAGVAVPAGSSIQTAVTANPAGTVFCLAAGAFPGQTVTPKASQQFVGARDSAGARLTVLDGLTTTSYAFMGNAASVVIRGLRVTRYHPPTGDGAIRMYGAAGLQVLDNEVSLNTPGAGVEVFTGWVVRKNWIHHNGHLGVTGQANSVGAVVDSNDISYNNLGSLTDPNCCAGGLKVVKATNLTLRGNYVHHNTGQGLWCDFCLNTTRYLGNVVDSNTFIGIYHEASDSAVIDGNTAIGNGTSNRGAIWVDNSVGVEVKNNTLAGGQGGVLMLRQVSRTDTPRQLSAVSVHDNTVTLASSEYTGLVQYVGDNTYFTTKGNAFGPANTYHTTAATPFRWLNVSKSWAQWQAAGQDAAGGFGP